MKEESFTNVFNTLNDLEATDAKVMENIYYYKVNDEYTF